MNFESEPFLGVEEFEESERFGPEQEAGLARMIDTGKGISRCDRLKMDFCKARQELRRVTEVGRSKRSVIDDEERKLSRWRCANWPHGQPPDKVKRICREVADKVARLKAELPKVEEERLKARAVFWGLADRLRNECSIDPAKVPC